MLKIFCLLFNFFLIFLLINQNQNKQLNQEKPIKEHVNFSEKQAFSIECEVKKGIFYKISKGYIFIKDDKYRLFLYHNSEKRIDSGCNDEYFWYWSYSEKRDTLFYSDRCEMDMVLKDCYKPSWMLKTFKNLDKQGEKYYLIKEKETICVAEILSNGISYNMLEDGIFINIKIKDAFKDFDESVFNIPKNEFKIYNKMKPSVVLPTIF